MHNPAPLPPSVAPNLHKKIETHTCTMENLPPGPVIGAATEGLATLTLPRPEMGSTAVRAFGATTTLPRPEVPASPSSPAPAAALVELLALVSLVRAPSSARRLFPSSTWSTSRPAGTSGTAAVGGGASTSPPRPLPCPARSRPSSNSSSRVERVEGPGRRDLGAALVTCRTRPSSRSRCWALAVAASAAAFSAASAARSASRRRLSPSNTAVVTSRAMSSYLDASLALTRATSASTVSAGGGRNHRRDSLTIPLPSRLISDHQHGEI
jgi:hypothetical protein